MRQFKLNLSVTECFNTIYLFVCLEFIVPLENFSLIWRRHHCRWKAANFDLCSALMAIEQWGFFNVPHLLRHGPNLYNGHLRGPVTLTSVCRAFGSWAVTTCFRTQVCCDRGSNPDLPHRRRTLFLFATAVTQYRSILRSEAPTIYYILKPFTDGNSDVSLWRKYFRAEIITKVKQTKKMHSFFIEYFESSNYICVLLSKYFIHNWVKYSRTIFIVQFINKLLITYVIYPMGLLFISF